MDILQNPLEKGEGKMGLVCKLSLKSFLFQAEVIACISLHIHKNPRQTDPLKVWPVFSIKRFTAAANKSLDARMFEMVEGCFEIFIILDGDRIHSKGPCHLYSLTYRTPSTLFTPSLVKECA